MSSRKPLGAAVFLLLLCSLLLDPAPASRAAELTEQVSKSAQEVKDQAEKVGGEAVREVKSWWDSIEPYRLKNRSRDEIVAWVIMGLMVGGLAGLVATLRKGGFGPILNLGVGLVGAFLGGILVHIGKWDFGWGPVLIRYEELAAAFVGAVVISILARLLARRMRRKKG